MEIARFRWRKRIAAFVPCFLVIGLLAAPASADRGDESRRFVEALADRAIQSLTTGDISRDERVKRFSTLFNESFAVETIGKWVLGRHWQQATPAERDEYLKQFEAYIVVSYVDRFAAYTGEKLRITKVLANDGEQVTVFSEIQRSDSGSTPVRVDWRIDTIDRQMKIVDLVVEGVSMSTTLRSDFGSIIRRDGGNISGLLAVLRAKTASLRTAN